MAQSVPDRLAYGKIESTRNATEPHIGVQLAHKAPQRLVQALQVALAIPIAQKARQPVVAALDRVLRMLKKTSGTEGIKSI